MDIKLHLKTEVPRVAKTLRGEPHEFSVTVITLNCGDDKKDPLMNLAYYNFDTQDWSFHTDTLYDMTDVNFVWFYVPDEILEFVSKLPPSGDISSFFKSPSNDGKT